MSKVIKSRYSPFQCEPLRLTLKEIKREEEMQEHSENQSKQMELNAYEQAERIIQEAQIKKEQIVQEIEKEKQQWEKERERLKEKAKKAGYEEGFQAGKEAGLKQYEEMIHHAKEVIHLAKLDYHNKLESSAETILLIAMKAAEKIIQTKLEEQPERFLNIVHSVMEEVKENPEVKICVHPKHYELVVQNREELQSLFTMDIELYIIPDHKLGTFAVEVESTSGKIDASVSTQVEQLKIQLLDLIRED